MMNPGLDHARECVEGRLGEAKVDHRIEIIRPLPIHGLIVFIEHIELDLAHGRIARNQQLAEAARTARFRVHGDDFLIRQHDAPLIGRDILLTKENLPRPQPDRVGRLAKDIVHDEVHHLIQEDRRHTGIRFPHHRQIGAFDGSSFD